MAKLDRFTEARQLSVADVLADADDGDGPMAGDLVSHVDYPDFRGKVEERRDGRCMVRVLDGWKGSTLPIRPVPIPIHKLEILS